MWWMRPGLLLLVPSVRREPRWCWTLTGGVVPACCQRTRGIGYLEAVYSAEVDGVEDRRPEVLGVACRGQVKTRRVQKAQHPAVEFKHVESDSSRRRSRNVPCPHLPVPESLPYDEVIACCESVQRGHVRPAGKPVPSIGKGCSTRDWFREHFGALRRRRSHRSRGRVVRRTYPTALLGKLMFLSPQSLGLGYHGTRREEFHVHGSRGRVSLPSLVGRPVSAVATARGCN